MLDEWPQMLEAFGTNIAFVIMDLQWLMRPTFIFTNSAHGGRYEIEIHSSFDVVFIFIFVLLDGREHELARGDLRYHSVGGNLFVLKEVLFETKLHVEVS